MNHLYTRSGQLLQHFGADLHSRSGRYLGHLKNGKVYDPDGRYCGTVVGDRIVYRTIDSLASHVATSAPPRPATTGANRTGCSLWGTNPDFAD